MPKRINKIFKKAITFNKILEAHNKTKKGKRLKKQVIEFEMNLESNIIQIGKELLSGNYQFSKYFEFTIYEPKERKIKTLEYRDRVVQTWYVENFLKPYFEPQFIQDSYACIKNRGTHKAVDKLQKYLTKAEKEYKQVWVLKCDIKKFFFNIDHNILYSLLKNKQKAKEILIEIKKFLLEKLKLELNSKTAYFKAQQGINFCGFRIWKTHKLIREQSKKKMKRKMKTFQKLYKKDKIELAYITACINSWKGHAKHANTYNLINKMFKEFVLTK